jgi:DNA topoisomerase-3
METAGKFVDEGELKEALKEKGLGTPATRADIIETLLKRGYVARGGKALSATDLGRYLIALIHEPSLKSPELTGEWEGRLREMEGGRSDPERFRQEVVEYTRRIVGAEADAPVDEGRLGDCPRCGKHVIEGTRGYGCSAWQDGCGFVLWRDYEGPSDHAGRSDRRAVPLADGRGDGHRSTGRVWSRREREASRA